MNQKKNILIFIGPPGSGKGSLSELCVKRLGWAQLSTGNLCREHIANQTEIGKQIDFAIKSGKLVSDGLIVDMVSDWLQKSLASKEYVIFDGFPRTVAQAEAFDALMKGKFKDSHLRVVRLLIDDETIVARILGRYICQNDKCQAVYSLVKGSSLAPKKAGECDVCGSALIRRTDDNEVSIKERLQTYHQHEKKLLDFYRKGEKSIVELRADKPLEEVFEAFKALMGFDDL